jgi:hypothetical protein
VPQRNEEPFATLATRVPKSLRVAVRAHGIEHGISAGQFIVEAIKERLAKVARNRTVDAPRSRPRHDPSR